MKRIVSLALVLVMALTCLVAFSSCKNMEKEIIGTYEMKSMSASVTIEGMTVDLDEDLFESFSIVFEEDGKATLKTKLVGEEATEEEAEWEWDKEDEVIKITSEEDGESETMDVEWEDGKITIEMEENMDGMLISMTIVLEKAED